MGWYSNHVPGNKPPETFRWFAMLRYEFVVLLMMTSFLLVKGLRIAMMYQGVNVEGFEAYGRPCEIRTRDQRINSPGVIRLLYQISVNTLYSRNDK